MSDEVVIVPPNSTGAKIDNTGLTVGGQVVLRQRQNIADPTDPLGIAAVKATALTGSEYAIAARSIVTDGLDTTQGAIADVAVTGDTAGTISGKLRGLMKILTDVWSTGTNALRITGTVAATQSGSWNVGGSVAVTNFPATQPVSGTVTISGNVAVTNAGLTNLDVALSTLLKPADTLASVATVGAITSALPAGSNVIGHVITDGGSTTAVTGNVAITSVQMPSALGPQPTAGSLSVTFASDFAGLIVDMTVALQNLLGLIANPVTQDAFGRQRVVLDSLGGNQTLGTVTTVTTVTGVTTVSTVTTVATVTNQAQMGGQPINSIVADLMNNAYGNQVLRCFT